MEKIKVNMSPNPLDVQTIHASQNDGEARQWEFELHNNGELIDTSEVTEQLFFKAYKGGTEQILPENTSTPTTSPFNGDIRYPQGLLTDQEFTYRQSPTEEDGLVKITDIKGNTLVWNQLVQNGNFASTSGWTGVSGGAISVANNEAVISLGASTGSDVRTMCSMVKTHKYLLIASIKTDGDILVAVAGVGPIYFTKSSYETKSNIFTWGANTGSWALQIRNNTSEARSVNAKNIMLFDLTQMGLDITEPSEFTSLFPLPYYSYNQGSLLSFNGNGIKTVSKNQFDTQVATTSYAGLVLTKTQGTIRAVYSGGSQFAGFNFYGSPVFTDTFLKGKYRLSFDVKGLDTQWTIGLRQGASFLGGGQALAISNDGHYSFTIDTEANQNCYLSFARTGNKTTAFDITFSNIQLELGTAETSYTPFEEQTISLPISQYFPWGMDGINNARDYKNETSYGKVIGEVDLGTLNYGLSSESLFNTGSLVGISKPASFSAEIVNAICPLYRATYGRLVYQKATEAQYCMGADGNGRFYFYDPSKSSMTAEQFKVAMNGIKLKFELKTPLENYGVVDLGTLDWTYTSTTGHLNFNSTGINTLAKKPSTATAYANIVCSKYGVNSENDTYFNTKVGINIARNGSVRVYDPTYNNVEDFKSAMQGVYLLYEKENPQGFTTASLVTENAEIPLSNEDGVLIGKCTEQLSENPGFIDAKIKLSDSDGTCYSNKLQLHVERSPQ